VVLLGTHARAGQSSGLQFELQLESNSEPNALLYILDPFSDDICALPAQAVLRCDLMLLLAPVGLQLVMERQVCFSEF